MDVNHRLCQRSGERRREGEREHKDKGGDTSYRETSELHWRLHCIESRVFVDQRFEGFELLLKNSLKQFKQRVWLKVCCTGMNNGKGSFANESALAPLPVKPPFTILHQMLVTSWHPFLVMCLAPILLSPSFLFTYNLQDFVKPVILQMYLTLLNNVKTFYLLKGPARSWWMAEKTRVHNWTKFRKAWPLVCLEKIGRTTVLQHHKHTCDEIPVCAKA